jgi:nucleotide-binding universal stress UspA family protein
MYARILVPVDGSAASGAGLDEAIRIARDGGASLRLLHVVDRTPSIPMSAIHGVVPVDLATPAAAAGAELLARCAARARDAGVEVETLAVEGLGRHLADFVGDQVLSWNADLIVMGTHGRRGFGRIALGSDAEQVARLAPVPVLLVRRSGRESVGAGVADTGIAA